MNPMPASSTSPDFSEFSRLAERHTLVPVTRTVAADLETPVGAFLRVAANEPEAFLLESVEGGEKIGRYTFIGVRPYRTLTARDGQVTVREAGSEHVKDADVFAELKAVPGRAHSREVAGFAPVYRRGGGLLCL